VTLAISPLHERHLAEDLRTIRPPPDPLLIFGSFASDGYQLACRMLVALAKAIAFATADSMIPTATDVARLIVS